jgi:hypothetical protein|eukprot:6820931-Prymnesium_polylepis.2
MLSLQKNDVTRVAPWRQAFTVDHGTTNTTRVRGGESSRHTSVFHVPSRVRAHAGHTVVL